MRCSYILVIESASGSVAEEESPYLTREFSLRNDEPALTPNPSLPARPAPPRHDPPSREGRAATVDDVRALLVAYHQRGDQRARARLVELHLPLVRTLARRLGTRGSQLEDLTQVG